MTDAKPMKLLMLVHAGPDFAPTPTMDADTEAWVAEAERRDARRDGGIAPPSGAVVVRVRDGELRREAGALPAGPEAVVGFDVLECADLDDAVDLVARHPMAAAGTIELRPVID